MDWPALAIGVLLGAATIRSLINGSASASGDSILRNDVPEVYWPVVVTACIVATFLIYKAFGGHS